MPSRHISNLERMKSLDEIRFRRDSYQPEQCSSHIHCHVCDDHQRGHRKHHNCKGNKGRFY